MKDGRHQEGLLHLHLDLALDGEGGFGDGGIPVAQDHLFVEQEDGVGFLERSGRGQGEVRVQPPTSAVWTYSAGAVAAHTPLRHHALASVDHEHLVLDGDLVFGLDGMFELQHAETGGEVCERGTAAGGKCTCLLRLHGEVGVKRQRAAIVDLEHIQLHVGSPRVQRLDPPCSFSLRSPGCRREHTNGKLMCLLWSTWRARCRGGCHGHVKGCHPDI